MFLIACFQILLMSGWVSFLTFIYLYMLVIAICTLVWNFSTGESAVYHWEDLLLVNNSHIYLSSVSRHVADTFIRKWVSCVWISFMGITVFPQSGHQNGEEEKGEVYLLAGWRENFAGWTHREIPKFTTVSRQVLLTPSYFILSCKGLKIRWCIFYLFFKPTTKFVSWHWLCGLSHIENQIKMKCEIKINEVWSEIWTETKEKYILTPVPGVVDQMSGFLRQRGKTS